MDDQEILQGFGKILITDVRDAVMSTMAMDYHGRFNTPESKNFQKLLAENNIPEELFNHICLKTIDEVIFKLLVAFEENHPELIVHYLGTDLAAISDGLGGDFLGDWIPDHSAYPGGAWDEAI